MKFKADQTDQKLRGGYYTPQNLADYVSKWVLSTKPKTLLEPSCGDGVFFDALANNKCRKTTTINGFELFDSEVKKTEKKCKEYGFKKAAIQEGDFLEWAVPKLLKKQELFEGVVGNPPFIRYQFLEENFQRNTEGVFKILGLNFTKHTNAWVPFILSSIALLKPNGRLGMVIPSEIIHVMHAQPLRNYLSNTCSKIVIIDPQEIWFEDTLQGAVILFAVKKNALDDKTEGVSIKHVQGFDFTEEDPNDLFNSAKSVNGKTISGKWTRSLLSKSELKLLNKACNHEMVHDFKSIAKVDVGIVTGANNFFLINDETVKTNQLEKYVSPMFGRSEHCKGIIYDKRQHTQNRRNGYPANFLYLDKDIKEYPKKVRDYISSGEKEGLHKRYKCRIRTPWYKVPSVYASKIGMLKRSHDAPRLILNKLEAFTTDTSYRIECHDTEPSKFVYCFLNPLTAISAELEGRYYGGGVLELVPSEIEKLYIPIPEKLEFDLVETNELIKNHSMSEVLFIQGKNILGSIGFTDKEVRKLTDIWIYLKNRRQRK